MPFLAHKHAELHSWNTASFALPALLWHLPSATAAERIRTAPGLSQRDSQQEHPSSYWNCTVKEELKLLSIGLFPSRVLSFRLEPSTAHSLLIPLEASLGKQSPGTPLAGLELCLCLPFWLTCSSGCCTTMETVAKP